MRAASGLSRDPSRVHVSPCVSCAMTPDPFKPDSPEAWEAMARYTSSEASDDEAAEITRWLESHGGDREMIEGLHEALARLTTSGAPDLDVEKSLAEVKARMRTSGVTDLSAHRARAATRSQAPSAGNRTFLRVAAALTVAVGGAGLAWMAVDRSAGTLVAETSVYTTGAGERDSVNLSDGTRVVLGPGSELVVAPDYSSGTAERSVSLKGEGYFDVVHSDARPFVIHAGNASVRDVGTVFSVRTLDSDVRVSVQEGAVVLQHISQTGDSLMLNAGDVGTLRGTDVLAEAGRASPDDLAWMQGRLVFRDASLDVVGDALKRSLGVHLQIDDPALGSRRLTTEFTGMAPADIGRALALAVGGAEEIRGDTVSIRTMPARR